ncbi:MAG: twitching motility protein PilT, partial [Gammaproteobacteria bacterium]|nr:twitching motility protein PilT [Gammaproteobacteria bacterium]
MNLTELLQFSVKSNASDLHLSAGQPPIIRVDGDMHRVNTPPLENSMVLALIHSIMNDKQKQEFAEHLECDFSYELTGLARFRVNTFVQNRGTGAV